MAKNLAKNFYGKTQYSPKLCAEVARLMAAGLSAVQVIAQWEISKDTFYNWLKNYPEFKEAYGIGKAMFDSQHEALGVEGMLKTRDIDYQFWRDLGKFRHGWSDKDNNQVSHTQINIDKVNILHQRTNEELIEYIKDNLEELEEIKSSIIDITPKED